MEIKTKIICTIGPSVNSEEKILKLLEAGMNVARLNFSHGSHEEHKATIDILKSCRDRCGKPMGILLDTKGPEIRVGRFEQKVIQVEEGMRLTLISDEEKAQEGELPINPGYVLDSLKVGTTVLFDDGYIDSEVIEKGKRGVVVEIKNSGEIKERKGVNIPGIPLNLPAMTPRDIEDIRFGCREDVDFIAASFIRTPQDILEIKHLLVEEKKQDILVFAKIENGEGIQNFDGILQVSDGIMIARGDLGVEVPLSQVPKYQKMMIRKCYMVGKPAITATQMLESMIQNPRPTRAEASDIANAIYDSTSAVMLSGETASGKYPVEAVRTMSNIIKETEGDFNYLDLFEKHSNIIYRDITLAVTLATVKTAYSADAKAIFIFTSSGTTAKLISRLRPDLPTIALTPNRKVYHQLNINWGLIPVYCEACKDVQQAFKVASEFALEKEYVKYGDLVVITAGSPFGISGTTNMMLVENIGEVLVRGVEGIGDIVCGMVKMVLSPQVENYEEFKDKILLLSQCDDTYLPLIKDAKGVILQNHVDDHESEKYAKVLAKTLKLPFIIRADSAKHLIQDGLQVTLDPENALIYKGELASKCSV